MRQVQASSGLLYDVFSRYDPENLLLDQARREVLESQLEVQRLQRTLVQIEQMEFINIRLKRLTPFSFPVWAEFVQARFSSEKWTERIKRMVDYLEQQTD
jgi:ATP-dependent Lhr-like helicase